jgi:hypothetical protein
MKKLITGILAILMCATCLTACDLSGLLGGGDGSSSSTSSSTSSSDSSVDPAAGALTWAEFTAKEDDELVKVKGVISGVVKNTSKDFYEIYFQDANGGYYAYGVENSLAENLQNGMEILVSGTRDTYYGINQVSSVTDITVLNSTPVAVQATDITAAATTAGSFKNADLIAAHQSKVVTIKGVTILGQSAQDDSYYEFSLGGAVSYARISGSVNHLSQADTTTFQNTVASNIGKTADVTGIVSSFSSKLYLIPLTADAFNNISVSTRTDAEKVVFEKDFVDINTYYTTSGTYELPATGKVYNDVTITWESNNETNAAIADGKLVVLLDSAAEKKVTLTATLACGEAQTQTVEVKIDLAKATSYIPNVVTGAPVVGTAYKFYMYQGNLGQHLYFTGEMDDKYLDMDISTEKAVDVKVEEAAGSTTDKPLYNMYFMDGTLKTYITVNNQGYVQLLTAELPTTKPDYAFYYDASINAMKTVEFKNTNGYTNSYVFGAKNTYTTLSANYSIPAFVAQFATLTDITTMTNEQIVARAKADLEFTATAFDKAAEVDLPTTNPFSAEMTIAWASSNTAVAAVEGSKLTVTLPAAATTVTLTATISYKGATDTKEFTINVASSATKASVAMSFANADNRTVNTTSQQVFVQDGVTFTYDKNNYNQGLADYTNPLRCYSGTKVTIASTGMTKIVIKFNSGKPVAGFTDNVKGATVAIDGYTVTLTFAAPTDSISVVLSAQVRIDNLTVSY